MSVLVGLLEAIAVLVPDFLTLGLVTLAFLNLCCIAKVFDVAGTLDRDVALRFSLALGYLVAIAINIWSFAQSPARSGRTGFIQSKSRVEQAGRESLSGTLKRQPVKDGGALLES
jgi:hypothetical protein